MYNSAPTLIFNFYNVWQNILWFWILREIKNITNKIIDFMCREKGQNSWQKPDPWISGSNRNTLNTRDLHLSLQDWSRKWKRKKKKKVRNLRNVWPQKGTQSPFKTLNRGRIETRCHSPVDLAAFSYLIPVNYLITIYIHIFLSAK